MSRMVEQLLLGEISMDIFLEELQNDQKLQEYIRSFVPNEAKGNPSHSFWKTIPYQSLQQNDFDYCKFLFWAIHSKGKIGKYLNVFSRLRRAYQYYYPEVECTTRYEDMFHVYLDAVHDCFDGPEVHNLVEQIITNSMQLCSNTRRIKHARMTIYMSFHVEKSKRPRWVQGPEWPMGSNSPMKFIGQEKSGDSIDYEFRDIDTGNMRIVKQYI